MIVWFWEYLDGSLPDRRKEKEEDDELRAAGLMTRTASRRQIQGYAIRRYMELVETMVWKPHVSEVIELLSGTNESGNETDWNEIDLVDTEIVEVHVIKFDFRQWIIDGGGDPDDPEDDMLAFMTPDDIAYWNGNYNFYIEAGYDKDFKTIIVNNKETDGLDSKSMNHFKKLFDEIGSYNAKN